METNNKNYICPRCQVTLKHDTTHQVELYLCPKDHGAWIEEEQVPLRLSRQLVPKSIPGHATHINHRYSPAAPNKKMELYYFKDIEVDVCMTKGGIWLDREETNPIIERINCDDFRFKNKSDSEQAKVFDWLFIVLGLF